MPTPFFVKGDPRINRKGRAKGRTFETARELARKVLDETIEVGSVAKTKLELIFRAQAAKAIKGDTKAAEYVVEWGYGKPPQALEIGGPNGGPIQAAAIVTQEGLDLMEARILGKDSANK
jgi:hypothetical protein